MLRQLLAVVLVLSVVTSVYSARSSRYDRYRKPGSSSSSKTSSSTKPPARYNPAVERIKFFTAAGKDSELNSHEFNSNRSKGNGFVRKTDSWSTMLRFDKDRNKMLDWFEADSYRRSQYKVKGAQVTSLGNTAAGGVTSYSGMSKEQVWGSLTKKYDRNGDGRLEGDEKARAYHEYKQIREQQEREERARREKEGSSHSSSSRDSSRGSSGSSSSDIWRELTKKYDKNGNGQLEGEEKTRAYGEYKQIRERQERERHERERREREERERRERGGSSRGSSRRSDDSIKAELLRRFDWNRDGKLEGREREVAGREYKRIREEESKRQEHNRRGR